MLVGVPENVAAVPAELARGRVQNVEAGDDERSGRRACEAREHAHERGLPGAARAEHDADLVVVHRERESLERGDASRGGRVDGEELACIDERRHQSASR